MRQASAAPAPEVVAQKEQLETSITQLTEKKQRAKKLVNMQTDEKIRLEQFRAPKIIKTVTHTVPSHVVAPRQQPARQPVHLGENFNP